MVVQCQHVYIHIQYYIHSGYIYIGAIYEPATCMRVDFSKALYSSTITRLNGCCSLFSIVRMKLMMQTGALLNAVGNNHIIIVFAQTTVRMEVKSQTKVML